MGPPEVQKYYFIFLLHIIVFCNRESAAVSTATNKIKRIFI